MHLSSMALILGAVMVAANVAESSGGSQGPESPAAAMAMVPDCAVPCLLSAFSRSGCSVSNTTCICNSNTLLNEGTDCIMQSCSLTDALLTKNISQTACHAPIRDRSMEYNVMNLSLGVITAVLIATRLVFKQFFSRARRLNSDDWVVLATLVVGIPCTVINAQGMIAHGLGKDVWTLPAADIDAFGEYFYILEVLYLTDVALIKLSLSFFYLRIFPGQGIRRALWATVVLNIVCGVTFVSIAIFQCAPISFYWTQHVDNASSGHCIDVNAFGWVNAAVSILIDIWMIAIPLSQIRKLELHWKKKIGATVMFMTGTFVTIVSILRLQSLIHFAKSTNPTWDEWTVALWSTIEVNVGMICTCLPCVRLMLVQFFPRVFDTNNSQDRYAVESSRRRKSSGAILSQKHIALEEIEESSV